MGRDGVGRRDRLDGDDLVAQPCEPLPLSLCVQCTCMCVYLCLEEFQHTIDMPMCRKKHYLL